MLQPEQSTDLDQPLRKVFGSKSEATKARLSLPEVSVVRKLLGDPVA